MPLDGARETVHIWASKGGRHWLCLYKHWDGSGYGFSTDGGGGNLGDIDERAAMLAMHRKILLARVDGINLRLKES